MKHATKFWRGSVVLAAWITMQLMAAASDSAQTAPATVRGKIVSLKGQELIVGGSGREVKVALTEKTVIRNEVRIKLSDIGAGMYLGTTATKQSDGTFLASEVHVFSEDQRGTGEGHRPLGSDPKSGATMTNANVERVEDVAVKDIKGKMITLKYKGGEVNVLVPPDIPIVKRVVVGNRSLLKNGAEVSLQAVPDAGGALSATQITVRSAGR